MFTEMMASGMGVPVFVGKAVLERRYPDFQKKHPSKRIQTKEMVGHRYPTLFLNFKGLKNE